MNDDIDMVAMLSGYLECALWFSVDDSGDPLDANYCESDISPRSIETARVDLACFVSDCNEQGIDLRKIYPRSSSIGHDLWLTRNRHGAGFWDRGNGEVGKALADGARAMGSMDPYVRDDGLIYFD